MESGQAGEWRAFCLTGKHPACIHTVHRSAGKERGRESESGRETEETRLKDTGSGSTMTFLYRELMFLEVGDCSHGIQKQWKIKYTPCIKETQFINAQWENYLINHFECSDSVAVSHFTCTRIDTSSELNPAKKNPGRICCMCCISYDVQWLEREESQYDMKLWSALFHIHDEALVEKIIKWWHWV